MDGSVRLVTTWIQLTITSDGTAQARGVSLADPDRILVAARTPVDASCADADEDGVAGIVFLQFDLLDVRSGELVPVSVSPVGGADIDDRAPHEVIVVIGATTFIGQASFRQFR